MNGMSAFLFVLLAAAALLLFARSAEVQRVRFGRRRTYLKTAPAVRRDVESVTLPRLVRQMASLLAAGRTGPELWGLLAHVVAAELPRARAGPWGRAAGTPAAAGAGDTAVLALLLAVQRASSLGLSGAAAIRTACAQNPAGTKTRRRFPGLSAGQRAMWLETAACLEVCEASGAPVAAVLNRLADTMEAGFDAAALRETALAGPRATVRLLGWLPFIGLGLGMAMGVDPMAVLFGSPLGWAVLCSGLAFTAAGRIWSASLISGAARPAGGAAAKGAGRRLPGSKPADGRRAGNMDGLPPGTENSGW